MRKAARDLAAAVRTLGDINIELCERPTEYSSECGDALVDGECVLNWRIG